MRYICLIDDEMVEVTPKSIRIRKTELDPNRRKAASKETVIVDDS